MTTWFVLSISNIWNTTAQSPVSTMRNTIRFHQSKYPELIEKFNIPLDEYPRRCIEQIKGWEEERNSILKDGKITHDRSKEYASYIMESIVTNQPYKIGGNVINNGSIENLPADAAWKFPAWLTEQVSIPAESEDFRYSLPL